MANALMRTLVVAAAATGLALANQAVGAQSGKQVAKNSAGEYPNKPVRFLVGPGPDTFARLIGQKLTESRKQQVVIDQRPGAAGIIAAETAAKAAPDGYTLFLTTGAEAGVAGFAFDSWNGVHVPARTPRAIIARLNAELLKSLKFPDVRERMLSLGMDPVGSTAEEFDAFVKADLARWITVVKDANVRVE